MNAHLPSAPLTRFGSRWHICLLAVMGCFAINFSAHAEDRGNRNTSDGAFSLNSLTGGASNTAMGYASLELNTTGNNNTASGAYSLYSNTTASSNTASGYFSLLNNTTGNYNTASGAYSLNSNTTASFNTASGTYSLLNNTTGHSNTTSGYSSLRSNTTGNYNTASGAYSLYSNTTASSNTASGAYSLLNNTTGNSNTASGYNSLSSNTTGSGNTATGFQALSNNEGNSNTATGSNALATNTTGTGNTAEGLSALFNNSTGSYNIAVGRSAGFFLTTGSNNIDIGNAGVAGEAGKIRIGTKGTQNGTFIAGISGVAVTGTQVVVNSSGKLGIAGSSARYKDQIKPMEKASEALLKLEPVTFRYKEELDPDGIRQFGLIAEQVEKVDPNLVVRDEDGKVSTVRYEAVNAMLLNEFLKEHRTALEQRAIISELKSKVAKQELTDAKQQKQIETLTATVQKVSNQIQLNKPTPRVVANK